MERGRLVGVMVVVVQPVVAACGRAVHGCTGRGPGPGRLGGASERGPGPAAVAGRAGSTAAARDLRHAAEHTQTETLWLKHGIDRRQQR